MSGRRRTGCAALTRVSSQVQLLVASHHEAPDHSIGGFVDSAAGAKVGSMPGDVSSFEDAACYHAVTLQADR